MKKIIYGCESRGDANQPYLSRWTLFKNDKIKIYFHKFHRSDADDLHDHPWNFISIILWRGYNEVTFKKDDRGNFLNERLTKRIYPLSILFRKADHTHRVELINRKPAYTLVFTGKYVRNWGFIVNDMKWQLWTKYFREKGC